MNQSKRILENLSLQDQLNLFTGKNYWEIEPLEGTSVFMSDGPHGLRKEIFNKKKKSIVKAICYPAACLSSCSFDVDLLNQLGKHLASEAIHNQVDILLGPGINIKRNPLCGRNFEYFSEDPFLTGKLASSYINGVQSKNVGVSLKHFAFNSQEYARFINNSIVDQRAAREIYLKAFEIAIKESNPWTIMASYNVYNGTHTTEHKYLLTDIGRNEFGFKGIYISDWGALYHPVESLKAGLDLEMPGVSKGSNKRLLRALENGELSKEELDASSLRIIDLYLKTKQEKVDDFDLDASLNFAKRVSDESIVLLKNEDSILPLNKNQSIALIGEFCKKPRYQGGGSSNINPIFMESLIEVFDEEKINYEYEDGYLVNQLRPNKKLIQKAKALAKNKDVVIIMAGLPSIIESEGYDRENLKMPASHLKLIEEVAKVNKNVIVVLQNGSPIEMSFVNEVKAIVEAYLGGSKHAESIKDVLFGNVNPSGRLSETFPLSYKDVASYPYYLKDPRISLYKESIYVGYRYYDTFDKKVLFPFGYGLSYANVIYSNYQVKQEENKYLISATITNTSDIETKEVVQLYIGQVESKTFKAKKELKAFTKITLKPNESKEITLIVDTNDLRHYSIKDKKWILEGGIYRFYLAKHSLDDSLFIDIKVKSNDEVKDDFKELEVYYSMNKEITDQEFEKLLNEPLPKENKRRPYTIESPIADFYRSFFGFIVFKLATFFMIFKESDKMQRRMLKKVIPYQPIRSLQAQSNMTKENIEGLVDLFNFHMIRGIRKLLSRKEKK